jgi:putative transposase
MPAGRGWLYLATAIDCSSRKAVGWATGDNYRTPLITSAIEMAARDLNLPEGATFHSDRGSNYTSAEFGAVLEWLGIRQSLGRTGICFDNSLRYRQFSRPENMGGPLISPAATRQDGHSGAPRTASR